MSWEDIRRNYPNQWVIIESLESHTIPDSKYSDNISVIEICPDGLEAMKIYRQLHKKYPSREFYFIHTNHKVLDIRERNWFGIRPE